MKLSAGLPTLFALLVASVSANTEKAIFTAPDAVTFTDSNPSLDVLQLESLALERSTLRTSLDVAAPGEAASGGVEDHWYLLRDLNPQQRYELRVCWSASVSVFPFAPQAIQSLDVNTNTDQQPTNFWIDVYNINEVFDAPELIQNLAEYAEKPERKRPEPTSSPHTSKESVLFLRVRAAAEFYTTNKDLMLSPPPRGRRSHPRSLRLQYLSEISRPNRSLHRGARRLCLVRVGIRLEIHPACCFR